MNSEPSSVGDLIRQAWKQGDATGWFEALYASAHRGQGRVPWAYLQPNPELIAWLHQEDFDAAGKSALVIGCGLGDDAEGLQEYGFAVTAFDISETAVRWCRERFPQSQVEYQVVDLFDPPEGWRQAFDFVLESRTIQALPYQLYIPAIAQIASFVTPGGTALVMCHGRGEGEEATGIPWSLARSELKTFEAEGLTEIAFKDYSKNGLRRFTVEYRRRKRLSTERGAVT